MPTPTPRITVHCIGNAHIDPVWRWTWQEGYTETLATCRAALDRLRETDDFVFSRGQAATYAWIEEADPDLFAEIRRYVAEGRWRLVNGWWEQPDANIPCGESYVRHALYGKRYFREKFGVDVTVGWNVDTFGHNLGLPQILAKSGFRTYCFFRPGRHEKELPGPYFWWQGPDGSRVLALRPPVGHYGTGGGSMADQIRASAEKAQEMGLADSILFYGVGNHGGGPTKENIASIRALRADPDAPNAIFSTVEAFAAAVAGSADTFPVVTDDLQHHAPGCYTTHSGIKRGNRQAENRLLRAERWCALAALALGRPYPAEEFAHAWKLVLFNQFHDILAGTSLPAAYDDSQEQIGEACAIAARRQNAALQALAARIDTTVDDTDPPAAGQGRPILLFNPSSWDRTDAATVQWGWRGQEAGHLVDETGAEVPFQFTQPDIFGGGSRIHFEATVPANGFRVYRLLPGDSPLPQTEEILQIGETWLENARWRLEFDPRDGSLTRLYDKANDVEALSGPACALLVMDDPGDTWGHGIPSWREEVGRFGEARFTRIESGPARVTLQVDTRWSGSTARQEFTLYRDVPRIDVTLTVDWHEKHKMLKLSVPVAIREGTLTYEAPYSAIVREANGREDPGQTWIDLSGAAATESGAALSYGVSLLNDSKYGFDCLDTDLRMSLLRSPIYCFHDPAKVEESHEYRYMDQGPQTIRYALLPHPGDWREGDTVRQAQALNNPLETLFQYPHRGEWGASGALLSVEPENVVLAAMKGAEEGVGTILRLFETQGRAAQATITLPGGRTLATPIAAWELKTLRLASDGTVREVSLLEE